MIQIGIPELLIILLVAFFSVKPEKIQGYIKTIYKFFIQLQNFATSTKEDLEKELNVQELKQDIFNETKIREFKKEKNE